MKEINLNEKVSVADTKKYVKGHIIVKDKDGNVIIDMDNMIVETGRKFLLSKCFGTADFEGYSISKIFYGEGSDMTTPNFTKEKLVNPQYADIIFKKTEATPNVDVEYSDFYVKINKVLTYTGQNKTLTEIGLIISNGTTEELFSRVVHDPIVLNNKNSEYTVNYYIYF